jgi:hypothetical protein
MILIKKWWVRLIFSLVVAAVIAEGLSLITENAININSFVIGIGLYLALSLIYGFVLMGEKKE